MRKDKLIARTALAAKIHDRYNSPYRIVTITGTKLAVAATREVARGEKRALAAKGWNDLAIQKRQQDGSYAHIR